MLYSSVLWMLKCGNDGDNLVGQLTRWGRLSADFRVVAMGNQPEHRQRVPALPRQVGVEDIRVRGIFYAIFFFKHCQKRHCLFVSNRLFWQESSLTRIQQRACLCATLSALDRVTLLYCCTVLSEFATVLDLWRSFFKQIMVSN